MQRFTELRVWQRSHALTIELYRVTASFPSHETFGLRSQIRRAAAGIATNLAEGSKREGSPDYARFINMAEGSAAELEYLVMLARELGYFSSEVAARILKEIGGIARQLHALKASVRTAAI